MKYPVRPSNHDRGLMVTRWLITIKNHQKRARMSCLQRGADVGWVVVEEGSKLEAWKLRTRGLTSPSRS
jgi:hypothetical protein